MNLMFFYHKKLYRILPFCSGLIVETLITWSIPKYVEALVWKDFSWFVVKPNMVRYEVDEAYDV